MEIGNLVGLGLTSSSLLVASAAFLLGFYLSEKTRGTPSDRLGLYKFTILSLAIPPFLITLPLIWMVLNLRDPDWILLSLFLIVSLAPAAVLIGVLIKSWD